jgi:hypothetical protein
MVNGEDVFVPALTARGGYCVTVKVSGTVTLLMPADTVTFIV